MSRLGLVAVLRDHTFRSLRHRNYRLYFLGQIVSFTGSWMQSAALMWLVFDQTNDPFWPPMLLVAQVGPTMLLGTWAGHLADRRPKRDLIFATQSAFLGTACLLTLLVASDLTNAWLFLGVQLLNGLIQAIDLPARLAFVPDLVPRDDLINAVSLNSLLFNSARAIGPALAGLLFLAAELVIEAGWLSGSRAVTLGAGWLSGSRAVTLGAVWCFTLNTLSYGAVLLALRAITIPGAPDSVRSRVNDSFWDGFRYVLHRPRMAGLLGLTGLLCVFSWPALSLFPAYTRLVLNHAEKEYSVLVSSLGAGALAAALTTATFGTVGRRAFFLVIGAMLTTVALGLLALASELGSAALAAGCLGFGMILFLSTGQSAMQLAVEDGTRGRVMALWAMTLAASAPIGHLLAGAAASAWPVRDVLTGMVIGTAVTTVGVAGLAVRGWSRQYAR